MEYDESLTAYILRAVFGLFLMFVFFMAFPSSKKNNENIEYGIDCCYSYFHIDDGVCEESIEEFESPKSEGQIILNFFRQTEYKDVAELITAQSALETGWWKDEFHKQRNNYWSRKRLPNGTTCIAGEKNCLLFHKDIHDSCESMYQYLKRKGYSVNSDDYLLDLKRKNFAEDSEYIKKVLQISKSIEDKI